MRFNLSNYLMVTFISFLGVIVLVSIVNSEFSDYFIKNWQSIIITFMAVLLGSIIAIGGIKWSFERETKRIINNEEDLFKRSITAMIFECAQNQAIINKLIGNIENKTLLYVRLSNEVSKNLMSNHYLYKYTGKGYIISLSQYIKLCEMSNDVLDAKQKKVKENGIISKDDREKIVYVLNKCLINLYITQYISNLYSIAFDTKLGPGIKEEEILKWLNGEIEIKEIKEKIALIKTMDDEEKKNIREGYKQLIEKIRINLHPERMHQNL